ncbi:MAG TPA: DUF1971 domain-containing protein, partial [Aquihabitans sp.]|nr:DUF1971 domain-containing protein [Aquihabitans sp.]
VETVAGRDDHLGAELDCSLCDRAEPPPGLVVARTAGPFDSATLPAGLRRDHRVGPRTWGRIRVLRSAVQLTMHTTPATDTRLVAGEEQHLPPGILHAVRPVGDVLVEVDFLTRPAPPDR